MIRSLGLFACLATLSSVASCARASVPAAMPVAVGSTAADPRLDRVIADYVGLYRKETLDQWEKLFLPTFAVASTRTDGGTTMRTRAEFFEAQRRYHDRVPNLREDLENVRVERRGRLASVWADFVVTEPAATNRGRLVLLLIEERGDYRIHSLMFSYDP